MSKIISKIGVKEFKECFEGDTITQLVKGGDTNAIGFAVMINIASVVLSNLPKVEKDVFAFLSSVTGLKVEEIENAPMAEFADMVISLFQKEDFTDFIKVVSRLFE